MAGSERFQCRLLGCFPSGWYACLITPERDDRDKSPDERVRTITPALLPFLCAMGTEYYLRGAYPLGHRLTHIHRQEASFVKRLLDWRQSGFLLSLSPNPSYISYFLSWRAFRASKRPKLNDPYSVKAFPHHFHLSSLPLTCGNLLSGCICLLMASACFSLNGNP